MSTEILARELKEACARAGKGDKMVAIHLFGIRNADRLKNADLTGIAVGAGLGESLRTELRKGVRLAEHVRER